MINLTKESEQVYYVTDAVMALCNTDLEILLSKLRESNLDRIRVCAHQKTADPLHEMIIILKRDAYVKPHKHLCKSESFHIIRGEADVVLFEENGEVRNTIELGELGSGKNFYYRLSIPLFHTVKVRSDYLIFHETTQGPFDRNKTVYPTWCL